VPLTMAAGRRLVTIATGDSYSHDLGLLVVIYNPCDQRYNYMSVVQFANMSSNDKPSDHNGQIGPSSLERRRMLKLIGVSGAAGLTGCMGGGSENSGNQSSNAGWKNTQRKLENPSRGGNFITGLKA